MNAWTTTLRTRLPLTFDGEQFTIAEIEGRRILLQQMSAEGPGVAQLDGSGPSPQPPLSSSTNAGQRRHCDTAGPPPGAGSLHIPPSHIREHPWDWRLVSG
ncbi:hypothetical protein DCW30_25205 [Streptomyces alfalfae]|nr:hypothetical protein D3X13_06270 [Streptomyces fradiae]RXX39358.1 hypothetical protein DCW30_25205 [Streptomyces alfalfae]RZM96274.1 hypothetical protein D4104_15710 [Streptomyces alfalfae]